MREVLEMRLRDWGFDVRIASDGAEGKRYAESYDPDIVVSDVVMPGLSGLELLRSLKAGNPSRPVILITAQGSIDLAVEAMKQGAEDFITKPLDYAKLKAILDIAQRDIAQRLESGKPPYPLDKESGFGPFVGMSKRMRAVYDLIQTLAPSDTSALITGESGTGKELAARTIHDLSARSKGPFIAINAAAIPEGLMESEIFGHEKGAFTGAVGVRAGCFEMASGGTLFLDEIAEMSTVLQAKLLRVLEGGRVRRLGGRHESTFDVRVIAATNQEPREAVQKGRLRDDLYYRLNVFTVALPLLRERKEDIPNLVRYFIREGNRKHQASVEGLRLEVLERLQNYSWPGNVRELKNLMERAVILSKGRWIELSHLPAYVRNPADDSGLEITVPLGASAAEAEKELILRTLEKTGNNKAAAARQLGLDVKTIRNKLKSYGREA